MTVGLTLLISFFICVILCPIGIPYLQKLKFGQNVRDDGPQSHLKKAGTPTMGGIMFLLAFFLGSIFLIIGNRDAMALLVFTMLYAVIGFIDDYIKVVKKRSLGLRSKEKIVLQFLVTTLFLAYLIMAKENYSELIVPFYSKTVDIGWLFIPFFYIAMIGTVNSVNLTDGLDGLASGVTAIVCFFFLFASYFINTNLMTINAAMIGSLLGFLIFNSNPAKVFMGDTGSLALGGFVGGIAMLLNLPLFILIVGFLYLFEAISVILQVAYFKKTGKRIFKMAPFHHHLELKGYKETQIVTIFYVTTILLSTVAIMAL